MTVSKSVNIFMALTFVLIFILPSYESANIAALSTVIYCNMDCIILAHF